MSAVYYKAVRPDGGSFHRREFKWNLEPGGITTHPDYVVDADGFPANGRDAGFYLSVAAVPTDCTGMSWPCRLLAVEPVGDVWTPDAGVLPNKRAGMAFRTVRELSATDALGPQGVQVAALIDAARALDKPAVDRLVAAWDAAGADRIAAGAAWVAAGAARVAAWDAAGAARAARVAAWGAAGAARVARVAAWVAAGLIVRDLISAEHYDALTRPWRTVIGPIHPDDPAVTP